MSLYDRVQKNDFATDNIKQELPELPEVTIRKSLDKWSYQEADEEVTRSYLSEIIEENGFSKLSIDYIVLQKSLLRDFEVDPLPAAIFLFALNLVRDCPDSGFMDMGYRYCPFWRKRLAPEAWAIVESEIKLRLRKLKEKKGSSS